MPEGGTFTFSDPDSFAAAFEDASVNLTITGVGEFKSQLTSLRLKSIKLYRCFEDLPRIAYFSFPPESIFFSFPLDSTLPLFGGIAVRNGNMVFHGGGEPLHQRFRGACQWGLVAVANERFASWYKALTGRTITASRESRIISPPRTTAIKFQRLFKRTCELAEDRGNFIERPEAARALEHELLHALTDCLTADKAEDNRCARHHHAAVMVRLEEVLSRRIDGRPNMRALCAEIGVAERTLRMCCAEFLGVSPTRYILLRRLNKARAALRRADPSTASVAQVARNHHFLELGRFAVTYRTTFGELPSATLQRNART